MSSVGADTRGRKRKAPYSDGNNPDIMRKFDKIDLNVRESDAPFDAENLSFPGTMPEFDPTTMPSDAACVVLGKRRTGKSHLVRDIISKIYDRYPTVIVSTGTRFNGFWQEIMPEEYVHEGFDEDLIRRIMAEQEKKINERRRHVENKQQEEDASEDTFTYGERDHANANDIKKNINLLYILDDVASEEHLHSSLALGAMFTKGRHYNISVWLLSQYVYAMSPAIRGNVDYAFIMHQSQRRSKEAIADEFMSQIPRRRDAAALMSKATPGYQCLVINNAKNTDELMETLSTYTAAEESPNYAVGDDEYYESVQVDHKVEELPLQMYSQRMTRETVDGMLNRVGKFPKCLQHSMDSFNLIKR